MKLLKKMFGIILAVIIVIENSSVLGTVKAAETDDRISVSMENGLRAEDLVFTGNPIEVSNTGLFVENVKDAGMLDIRIQFKITDAATDYINLLEICDTSDQSSSSSDVQPTIAVIVSKTGTVFLRRERREKARIGRRRPAYQIWQTELFIPCTSAYRQTVSNVRWTLRQKRKLRQTEEEIPKSL